MKKKVAISFIVLSVLIVLVSGTIPHHHHGNGAMCFFMAHCENNNSTDDKHTSQNTHTCHHETTCIAEANYYINPESKVKIKAPSCDNCDNPGHIHLFPLFYLVSDFLIYPAYNTYTKPKYGEYILFYTSAEVSQFHGLRAPPFTLS
ncbi:DUF6769 family protein [uncultured Proteiniphilum sp.]|uniref:DUF6769 family protein n=1 Tax=uncultured Proteiniphilum sp. TaxID=497637 RepID=UPI002603BE4D|nr:DUF6769 family protein [uncultured Proteiniphilum sp.]